MSLLYETAALAFVLTFLVLESLARGVLTGFYAIFPFRNLLDALYVRLTFLREIFSAGFAGPRDPVFKADFRHLVLQHQQYEVEEHYIKSRDGFTLLLHRIKRRSFSRDTAKKKKAIYETTTHRKQQVSNEKEYSNEEFSLERGQPQVFVIREHSGLRDLKAVLEKYGAGTGGLTLKPKEGELAATLQPSEECIESTASDESAPETFGGFESKETDRSSLWRRNTSSFEDFATAPNGCSRLTGNYARSPVAVCRTQSDALSMPHRVDQWHSLAGNSSDEEWAFEQRRREMSTTSSTAGYPTTAVIPGNSDMHYSTDTEASERVAADIIRGNQKTLPASEVLHKAPEQAPCEWSVAQYPILLMHGLMMSSECFVFEKRLSIAFTLADMGYDVWLGNNRGNKYSWQHKTFKRDEDKYWDFSMDEMALYDIPTFTGYIIRQTGKSSLAYIGYSNGSAQMFAALSTNVNLNKFISVFIALAPACKLRTLHPEAFQHGLLLPLVTTNPRICKLLFGSKCFLGITVVWQKILSAKWFAKLIDHAIFILFAWRPRNMTERTRQLFYAHLYSTTSARLVRHWFQMLTSGKFEYFAAGTAEGIVIPQYRIEAIDVPVVLIYGGRDRLSDVHWIWRHLSAKCELYEIEHYEHLDPLVAKDAPLIVGEIITSAWRRCLFMCASSLQVHPLIKNVIARYAAPQLNAQHKNFLSHSA